MGAVNKSPALARGAEGNIQSERYVSRDNNERSRGGRRNDKPAATPMRDAALSFAKAGFYVFPLSPKTKLPITSSEKYPSERPRWGATRDPARIETYWSNWPRANIGVETGTGFLVVDVDTRAGHPNLKAGEGIEALDGWVAAHGGWPETRTDLSPSGGPRYWFKYPPGLTISSKAGRADGPVPPGIEIFAEGGMVAAPPSVGPVAKGSATLAPYRWTNNIQLALAPAWLIDLCKVDPSQRFDSSTDDEIDIDKVCAVLDEMPNGEAEDYNNKRWSDLMRAAWRGSGGDEKAFAAFDRFSRKSKKYEQKETAKRWMAFRKERRGNARGTATAATLYWEADQTAPGWRDRALQAAIASAFAPIPDDAAAMAAAPTVEVFPTSNKNDQQEAPEVQETAPAFSEEWLALEFTNQHVRTLRYVAAWGKWLIFDGGKWNCDDTLQTFSMARKICRAAAQQVNKPKSLAKQIASAKTRNAIVSLASSDRRHAATVDQWDIDPWALNTPGGVIDLRTGKLRDHRATDYMTKSTAVTPDAKCPTPLWRGFLKTVTAEDIDLQRYIQRVLGYCLTGITIEHALFFLYGMGGNGKGVMTNTVAGISHDYHETAPLETFTINTNERHPTELAMLRGARLVTVSETEAGRRWAESRIKTLTGGDPIDARFMRQDYFRYVPQFKLMISGNHRPGLNSVNEAIRRRVNMLPFNVTIGEEQRDKNLTEKLKVEWSGILAWMIEGCLEWQRIGLQPPKIVTDATDDYLESEDKLGRWISECLIRDPNGWASSSDLFNSWKNWAEDNHEWLGSQTKFSSDLKEAGFKPIRRNTANGFAGLTVAPVDCFTEQGQQHGWR